MGITQREGTPSTWSWASSRLPPIHTLQDTQVPRGASPRHQAYLPSTWVTECHLWVPLSSHSVYLCSHCTSTGHSLPHFPPLTPQAQRGGMVRRELGEAHTAFLSLTIPSTTTAPIYRREHRDQVTDWYSVRRRQSQARSPSQSHPLVISLPPYSLGRLCTY